MKFLIKLAVIFLMAYLFNAHVAISQNATPVTTSNSISSAGTVGPHLSIMGMEVEEQQKHPMKHYGMARSSFTPEPTPNQPAHFSVKAGDGIVRLSWDHVLGAFSYLVYISDDGQNFKRLTKKPIKTTSAIFKSLENGRHYYFGVTSCARYGGQSEKAIQSVVLGKSNSK